MACTSIVSNPNVNKLKFPTHASPRPWSGGVNVITKSDTLATRRLVVASAIMPTVATKVGKTMLTLARAWREVQGSSNWEGLVDPLDPLLRHEIIRYGDFVTACYKAFDLDPTSKRYLNCKYGKKSMLREVGLGDSGYEVTKYIYATPDINIPIQNDQGRWIGYVAVSSEEEVRRLGRRDILITFRGTVTNHEWVANFMSSLTPARLDPHNPRPDVKVEAGFLTLYTSYESTSCKFGLGSCREQLLSEVSRLLNKYKGEEMSITLAGHSMGSSLALLLAYDIAELGLNRNNDSNQETPVTVFSFAGPRVGNSRFKRRCEELGVKVMRIVNVNDPITKLPGVVFNDQNFNVFGERYELPWSYSCYAHVGVELALDFFKMQNPSCVHDLETYISLLRCPKGLQIQKEGIDSLNKAREFILSAQNFDALPWKNAASTMMSLVQSQRIFSWIKPI
ncbi:alpha/beta-Hydrolases superfamily protein [Actinidia rufa]|uniref:Alpha/beta-Hydrolases superfamily protein n=1 Tax=Actinidia rufa TaxID=165716 RepID=A0A7J0F2D4_9ERIC|nr:alpha/beta-Hydrolases superfamily protein [Actinidia rufa]